MKKILLLLALPFSLQAGIVCVDDDNSSTQNGSSQFPFNNLQTAVSNAADFDTVQVATGSYGRFDNLGKPLVFFGGYAGGAASSYMSGSGGDFINRSSDPSTTVISGGQDSSGVTLTRFTSDPYYVVLDNLTVSNSLKGIVCDVDFSWPHAEHVTIVNCIIENNGQPGISTLGAGILVAGNRHIIQDCVIRNNHGGRGAGISGNNPDDTLLIMDNLIENNTGYDDHSGGIYLGGYVTMTRNIISGNKLQNSYGWGGGVLILGTAYMSFNTIKNNSCPSYGGAVFIDEGGIAYMDHELIYGNSTGFTGGGVALDNGAPGSSYLYMTNSTVVNNFSTGLLGGNAVYTDVSSFATVKNCIMYGNDGDFYANSGSSIAVTYTLNEDGATGAGNFTADPLFADTLNEDFQLKSRGGRYNPLTQAWITDNVHSPAIDAGDSSSAYSNEPAPNGNRVNLGCFGNTNIASKSFSTGLDDISKNDDAIIISPNPSSGIFNLDLKEQPMKKGSLIITNRLGEKVFQTQLGMQDAQYVLNLAWLSNGTYIMQIQTFDAVHTKELTIAL